MIVGVGVKVGGVGVFGENLLMGSQTRSGPNYRDRDLLKRDPSERLIREGPLLGEHLRNPQIIQN